MSKFQQFWWYVGVGTVFVGLILSVVQGNWFLAILCAVVTAGLRKIHLFFSFVIKRKFLHHGI